MNNLKKLILILIYLLFTFCNNKTEIKISNNFIKSIQYDKFENMSFYTKFIFIKNINDSISIIDVIEINHLYDKKFCKTYRIKKDFFQDLLYQKIKIEEKYKCFKLNEIVLTNYKNFKFNNFIDFYFLKENSTFIFNKHYTENVKLSLMYIMFINDYHITQNDYNGKYNIINNNLINSPNP